MNELSFENIKEDINDRYKFVILQYINTAIKGTDDFELKIKLKLLKKYAIIETDPELLYSNIKFTYKFFDETYDVTLSDNIKLYVNTEYKKYINNIE